MNAFMADPTATAFLFGDGYRIELAASVAASNFLSLIVRAISYRS